LNNKCNTLKEASIKRKIYHRKTVGIELLLQLPTHLLKTIICSRGKELTRHKEVNNMYFAVSYCAGKKKKMKNIVVST
jgi:IS30 family transposase